MTGLRRLTRPLAVCALALAAPAFAADVKVGDAVEKLTFKDIRYLPRSLDDFGKKNAYVLVFTTTTCPVAQRYLPVLRQLDLDYRDRGVQVVAVNVGSEDSIALMAAQAVKAEAEFPFVKDFDGDCVRALGVKRTPEAVVLDGERRLRYRGRIDDRYRLGGARSEPTRFDLKEALDQVLAGKEVEVKETPVDGCLISFPKPRPPERPVTYEEHVAPILKKHCQECHRPGTAAPFSLQTYRQTNARADTIAEVVREQRMPPWYASPEHGDFTTKRGLSAEERETILAWVHGGTPQGDPAKGPEPLPALNPEEPWQIGKPDLVLNVGETHEIPATGPVAYKYALLPHLFTDDTWVSGIQILPDNPRVVHHCNMAYVSGAEGFKASNFIMGYVPGVGPANLEEGVALKIPKGSALLLQIHYVSTGKDEKCKISVGFRYARGVVHKQLRHFQLVDKNFAIPPGAPAYKASASRTLEQDVVGYGLFAHMHLRGKDMTFTATTPDGKSETLLMVPNYSFDWQQQYKWPDGKVRFTKGTRIDCVAHYDNSAFNPYNPDPKATVRFGQQTEQEMMNGFFFYTHDGEDLNLAVDEKTGHAKAP